MKSLRTGKAWLLAAVFVSYGVFLLVEAPASLVAWALGAATRGAVILEGSHGKLWHGRAAAMAVTYPSGIVERYEGQGAFWSVEGPRLIHGELAWRLGFEDAGLRVRADVSVLAGAVRLTDISVEVPASAVNRHLSLPASAQPGTVSLHAEQLEYRNRQITGEATVHWRDADNGESSARRVKLDGLRLTGDNPMLR